MEQSIPTYYSQFHCLAGACPDSCCKEWEVDVDDLSARRYRTLPGPLGDRLRQVLQDTPDGTVMTIENGRCPMWQPDGLCRIQAQLGHDALCQICRQFPRLHHHYGDFEELGLELSCPEAARLILTAPRLQFETNALPGGASADYDRDAMATLRKSRAALLSFLADGAYAVPQALTVMLLYSHQVQSELDGGAEAFLQPQHALATAKRIAAEGNLEDLYTFFKSLEILTDRWQEKLDADPGPCRWQPAHLALARYFVGRYWLQAVWDLDLISRVKLAVTACLLISSMDGDPIETAQLFSKEIENDPENLDALLDAAYMHPALTDQALLSLLAE